LRLWRNGEALADMVRINRLFSERYKEFDSRTAERRLFESVRRNEGWLAGMGDGEGARVCRKFWKHHAPIDIRLEVAIATTTSFIGRSISWGVRRVFGAMRQLRGRAH
jgi:hypothetical protein